MLLGLLSVVRPAAGLRRLHARPRLPAAGGRAQGSRRRSVRLEERGLREHVPPVLGLRPRPIRRREAGRPHGLPGRPQIREHRGGVPRPRGLRQPDPQGADARHHRALRQPRAQLRAVPDRALAAEQPRERIRRPRRPVRAAPDRRADPGDRRRRTSSPAIPRDEPSAAPAPAASAPSPRPGSGPTTSAR